MPQDVGFKKTAAAETQYSTGAKRDNREGKGAFHWMPWDALWLVSNIYEKGNKGRSENPNKDGHDRNWEKGMPILDYLQSAMNHITAHISGDRSEPHISQAIWNLLNYLQVSIWIMLGFRPKELNQLPDHRHDWNYGDEPPCPLSEKEVEWLRFKGVIPKEETLSDFGPGAEVLKAALRVDPDDKEVITVPKSVTVTAIPFKVEHHHDPDPGDVHHAPRN
jgi:hypothetical protein